MCLLAQRKLLQLKIANTTEYNPIEKFSRFNWLLQEIVQGHGKICRALHDMLKKNSFQWGDLQEEAFNQLKQCMATALVLALPDVSKPFVL